ncbi:phosphoesterase [Halobacillus andaensis]|uniref:Phosphoesterase n=1 Tax=Halobacillus andaensis TaxID=1176239 RepID=A0A917EVB8_HALAA|nr:metallophosphoesterase [Halobacillus andaensis]MBP2004991.1 putative phosphoesterase [Halobacillus andaensis]GGF17369.1 phosphoesterase [Halobacillus andaensis]
MEIIVVSDTHLPKKNKGVPTVLKNEMKKADLVIHAGDWQTPEVYEQFQQFGELVGVYGNVDGTEMKDLVPRKEMLQINGFTIGVVHGHGEKKTTEKRVIEEFEDEEVDLIIFGHSHLPLLRFVKKTMLFNPGSATDKRRLPYYSFGKLTIKDEMRASHHFYSSLL